MHRPDLDRPYTYEDRQSIGLAFCVFFFVGTMAFGGSFWMGLFMAMIGYVIGLVAANAVDVWWQRRGRK